MEDPNVLQASLRRTLNSEAPSLENMLGLAQTESVCQRHDLHTGVKDVLYLYIKQV